MTPTQLLMPRYKVVAPDTSGRWKVGDIYTFVREVGQSQDEYKNQDGKEIIFNFFSVFPHLFRRMEWHEERELSDMPEYIKQSKGNGVYRCKWLVINNTICAHIKDLDPVTRGAGWSEKPIYSMSDFLPATPEEYQDYINNKK
jgi:hypothetical protein